MNGYGDVGDKAPLTVTIKSGKGYEDTWLVFNGSPAQVKANMAEVFGLDPDLDVTISEYALLGQAQFQAIESVQQILGGRSIPPSREGKPTGGWPDTSTGANPFAAAAGAASTEGEVDPVAVVKAKIEAATGRTQLKDLWLDNQALFNEHAELGELYSAKGKSLPEGS